LITFSVPSRSLTFKAQGSFYSSVFTVIGFLEMMVAEQLQVKIDCSGILESGETITSSSTVPTDSVYLTSTGFVVSIPIAGQLYNTHLYNSGALWDGLFSTTTTSVTVTLLGSSLSLGQTYNLIVNVTTSASRKISVILPVVVTLDVAGTTTIPPTLNMTPNDTPSVAIDYTNYLLAAAGSGPADVLVSPVTATMRFQSTGAIVSSAFSSGPTISGNTITVTINGTKLTQGQTYIMQTTGNLNNNKVMGATTLIKVIK